MIIGTPGCSLYFILGLLDVRDLPALERDLESLRKMLLADPYFKGVPSMQPEQKKTSLAFHAKDDLPEVRREVFSLLLAHDLRFLAVVRDKTCVAEYVHRRNELDTSYRYHPNELYDSLVRRSLRNLLHKEDKYDIYFARRGKSDRTAALQAAIEAARVRFAEQFGVLGEAPVRITPCGPTQRVGLQATDCFLWALQRFYEMNEDRFLSLAWPRVRLVHDVDDTRNAKYGEYYSKERPLTIAARQGLPGI